MSHADHSSLPDRVGHLFRRLTGKPVSDGRTVAVGQRFFRVSTTAPVWVVRKVYTPEGHVRPHVVLQKADQAADQNLIAIDLLLDENAYRPDRRAQRGAYDTSRPRRRRDDPKTLFFR
jgi:hypothetical protein